MSIENQLRHAIVKIMKRMDERGLNRGTSGNVSARVADGMLITPSGIVPELLTPEAVVRVNDDGTWDEAGHRPSSEWRMHMALLKARADAGAVVHCHSRYATILACAGREIPALHYMVAVAGGSRIPLAPYATFGSDALAQSIVTTIEGYRACLMANHGQIATAPNLEQALAVADEVEEQAAVYCGTLSMGGPILLDDPEMERIKLAFSSYGQKASRD